jgi:hypothetical protein
VWSTHPTAAPVVVLILSAAWIATILVRLPGDVRRLRTAEDRTDSAVTIFLWVTLPVPLAAVAFVLDPVLG